MREIVINENDASQRLDKFLMKFMPKLPSAMLYKSLRKNCVRINGKHVKDGAHKLNAGDKLSLYFKDEFFSDEVETIKKSNIKLDIVYEDENIILINKPVGIVAHADDKNTADTLIDGIKSYLYEKGEYNPSAEQSFSPALCNRLDRNTRGIIIAAKNAAALRAVNEKIRERQIQKLYLCIADGIFEKKSDILTAHLTRHEKMVSVSDTIDENSKLIKTKYTVIAETDNASLVEVELLTGRTHQIRAQLSAIGHPLSGDTKYGSKTAGKYKLCSYKLRFDFAPDGGILDYLTGAEFSIAVDFAKKFSSQKS